MLNKAIWGNTGNDVIWSRSKGVTMETGRQENLVWCTYYCFSTEALWSIRFQPGWILGWRAAPHWLLNSYESRVAERGNLFLERQSRPWAVIGSGIFPLASFLSTGDAISGSAMILRLDWIKSKGASQDDLTFIPTMSHPIASLTVIPELLFLHEGQVLYCSMLCHSVLCCAVLCHCAKYGVSRGQNHSLQQSCRFSLMVPTAAALCFMGISINPSPHFSQRTWNGFLHFCTFFQNFWPALVCLLPLAHYPWSIFMWTVQARSIQSKAEAGWVCVILTTGISAKEFMD